MQNVFNSLSRNMVEKEELNRRKAVAKFFAFYANAILRDLNLGLVGMKMCSK